MKENLADLTVILDRSGSMQDCREATMRGFNKFMEEQRAVPGEASVTLVQFDDQYEIHWANRAIADAPGLTAENYVPRGSTALLDAIGRTITDVGGRLAAMPEAERPGRVVIIIQTDGMENASMKYTAAQVQSLIAQQRDVYGWQFVFLGANQDGMENASMKYTAAQVQSLIAQQRDVYGWQFVFLGANQDAIAAAARIGIGRDAALTYGATKHGTAAAFSSTSAAVASYRTGASACMAYTEQDRADQAPELGKQ